MQAPRYFVIREEFMPHQHPGYGPIEIREIEEALVTRGLPLDIAQRCMDYAEVWLACERTNSRRLCVRSSGAEPRGLRGLAWGTGQEDEMDAEYMRFREVEIAALARRRREARYKDGETPGTPVDVQVDRNDSGPVVHLQPGTTTTFTMGNGAVGPQFEAVKSERSFEAEWGLLDAPGNVWYLVSSPVGCSAVPPPTVREHATPLAESPVLAPLASSLALGGLTSVLLARIGAAGTIVAGAVTAAAAFAFSNVARTERRRMHETELRCNREYWTQQAACSATEEEAEDAKWLMEKRAAERALNGEEPLGWEPTEEKRPNQTWVRRIEITTFSKDQGWVDDEAQYGTYDGSFSWFEVSLLRNGREVPRSRFEIQRNVCAGQVHKQHDIILDLDHPLTRMAQKGDRVVLWARALYPGWTNNVRRATVTVYSAPFPPQ